MKGIKKKGYGYEKENPIKTCGILGSEVYMNSLQAKEGVIIKWKRISSFCVDYVKHILDAYSVFVLHFPEDEEEPEIWTYTMFLDMYNRRNDTTYPEDFKKKDEQIDNGDILG